MGDTNMKATDGLPVVVPTGGRLGAEIRGVDLRRLGDDAFAAIHRAWLDNLVLLFRGHKLTDADLIAFSRRFGELDLAPIQETGRRFVEGMPELYVVSNVVKDGEPIGSLGYGEAVWHTDMSYLPDPPMASMLYALEIPPAGGNTGFVNMYAIYEALPVNAEFGWHTAWQVGDLVLWDNRCTMHRRDPFDTAARRHMHRNQRQG